MIWLAYFSLLYMFIRTIVLLLNLAIRPYMNSKNEITDNFEKVSICIPARNEEGNILFILNDLLKQTHKNIEVLVYNDQSTDNTLAIVKSFKEKGLHLKILDGGILPSGWNGKNNACNEMSKLAKAEYILFVDADVRLEKNAIESAIRTMKKEKLDLLSLFPLQIMYTRGEQYVVPIINKILLSHLWLFLVPRRNFTSLSAANGQFMFFKAETYKKYNFHKLMYNCHVEDILIARYMKKNKCKVGVYMGRNDVSCRMYNSYNSAIIGFSKNIFQIFGSSYLFIILYLVFASFGLFIVCFNLPIYFTISYLIMNVISSVCIGKISGFSLCKTLFYSVHHILALIKILWLALKDNKVYWKGRVYET